MNGLLLRLAGPLQSWSTHSRFNDRDTHTAPTRSGLIGLIASALGYPRHRPPGDLTDLSFTLRIDQPGTPLSDFHTAGGGLPARATIVTGEGKRRPAGKGTLTSHRHYLAGAAFTLAVTAPEDTGDLIDRCAHALAHPTWPPFLGRRSCPPAGPLLLAHLANPQTHLSTLPLSRPRPSGASTVVEFHTDNPGNLTHLNLPPTDLDPAPHLPSLDLTDEPVSYHHLTRTYRTRTVHRATANLPSALCADTGTTYLRALTTYLKEHAT